MRTGDKLGSGWFSSFLSAAKRRDRKAVSNSAPKKPAKRRPAPSGRIEKPRSVRILIIDDEPQVATALKRLLHRHEVQIALTGSEARELLSAQPFDVVVSDVMMPDPQRSSLVTRFIFVTGGVQGTKAHKFLASISNPKLGKPVDALEMEHAIAHVMIL